MTFITRGHLIPLTPRNYLFFLSGKHPVRFVRKMRSEVWRERPGGIRSGEACVSQLKPSFTGGQDLDLDVEGAGVVVQISLIDTEEQRAVAARRKLTFAADVHEIVVVVSDDSDQGPCRYPF